MEDLLDPEIHHQHPHHKAIMVQQDLLMVHLMALVVEVVVLLLQVLHHQLLEVLAEMEQHLLYLENR
jgi:hypothetical protein